MTWGGNISRAYFKSPVWCPWANVDLNPGAVLQLNFDFVPFIRTIAPLYNLCWKQSELFWRWNDFIVRLSVTQMAFLNVKFFLWFFQFHIYFIRSLFMLKRHLIWNVLSFKESVERSFRYLILNTLVFLFHVFLFKMFFVSLGAMWQIHTNNRGERASLNWLEEKSSEREYAQSAAKFTEQRIR